MSLQGYLLLVFVLAFVISVGVFIRYLYKEQGLRDNARKKLRSYKFLFRWWLIGRYYCESETTRDKKLIKLYKTLHKIFWGAVSIGLCLVVAEIVEMIQWII